MRGQTAPALIGLSLLVLVGCATQTAPQPAPRAMPTPAASSPTTVDSASPSNAAASIAHTNAASAEAKPVLAIFDYEALRLLEQRGFDLATFGFGLESSGPTTARQLTQSPAYASMIATIRSDIRETAQNDPAAGVGMKHAHRLFDAQALDSDKFHYELAAVVNRVDRKVFSPGTCGELRLIYRLAYESEVSGQRVASRLPMTINVVRYVEGADCAAYLRSWQLPSRGGVQAADGLTGPAGPLSQEALRGTSPKSVEVNLQSVRWPSTVRPNMAGHAEYVLRVFKPAESGKLVPSPLENTPDVERLKRDRQLKAKLLQWLQEPANLEGIDAGTALLPDEFLATKAVSVAPRGLARLKNRPFAQLFPAKDMQATLGGMRSFSSGTELLRRLDGLSCQGCHQSKSLAGFHALGRNQPDAKADALSMPHSAHFTDDMRRRNQYAAALLTGEPPEEFRPAAERAEAVGGWGSRCGLNAGAGGSFTSWTCGEGLKCVRVDDPEVGQCMPQKPEVGDACELGLLPAKADQNKDFTRLEPAQSCGENRVCEANGVGFPGGMCAAPCSNLPAEATCGGIALLTSFNACLARQEPFESCILNNTRPGALRSCSHEKPCREDYVCAQTAAGQGACLPPYFLFQLRVDGHVY